LLRPIEAKLLHGALELGNI